MNEDCGATVSDDYLYCSFTLSDQCGGEVTGYCDPDSPSNACGDCDDSSGCGGNASTDIYC